MFHTAVTMTLTTCMGIAAFMSVSISMGIAVIIIIARALKVSIPTLTNSCWACRRRMVPRDIGVPPIVIVIALTFIVNVVTRVTVAVLLWVHRTRSARVPGLRVPCWQCPVVWVRGIPAWTIVPRVTELVLAPILAGAIRIRIRPTGLASQARAPLGR